MKMTNEKQDRNSVKEARTRWSPSTRYEIEISGGLESNEAAGNMKNFPRTFIPTNELEGSR
jgi:hypothetical protein